jgi:hypothetical protein
MKKRVAVIGTWIAVLAAATVTSARGQDDTADAKRAVAAQAKQQQHAARLIDLARRCAEEKEGLLVTLALEPARALDAAAVEAARVPYPATHKERGSQLVMFAQMVEAVEDGSEMSPKALEAMGGMTPLLPQIATARVDAARDLAAHATELLRADRADDAYATAKLALFVHRTSARDVHAAAGAKVAERRHALTTKPFLDRLARAHDKIGRSKGWQLRGPQIEAPPPDAENAVLLAKDRVRGDFSIEAEVQFAATRGTLMLVVAWVDAKNYCGLEYQRGPGATLRLVHVAAGNRTVLAESQRRPRTYDEWFPLRVRVEGGVMTIDGLSPPCSAELPIRAGDGLRWGLLRPGDGDRDRQKRDTRPILLRNLLVQ